MDGYIDLHTHTTCSDGSLSPDDVVRTAFEAGLRAVAICDHDSVSGVKEAVDAGKKYGIEVVPSVELSVEYPGLMHILGFYINAENSDVVNTLASLTQNRLERAERMCSALNSLGFDINLDEVKELSATDNIGRAHFAKLMLMKGYVSSINEAFEKYVGAGKPAYCSRKRSSPEQAISFIRSAVGIPVIAHVHSLELDKATLYSELKRLKACGLMGIEGYYTEYTQKQHSEYCRMAEELGLLISGGSDFHGSIKPLINIGTGYGNLKVPYSVLQTIKNNRDADSVRPQTS